MLIAYVAGQTPKVISQPWRWCGLIDRERDLAITASSVGYGVICPLSCLHHMCGHPNIRATHLRENQQELIKRADVLIVQDWLLEEAGSDDFALVRDAWLSGKEVFLMPADYQLLRDYAKQQDWVKGKMQLHREQQAKYFAPKT